MSNKNLVYNSPLHIDGIVDTGIIVTAHFQNPIQQDMLKFLKDIFIGNSHFLIPLTTFVGAYHILTQYLKVSRYNARISLNKTLELGSNYFYEDIQKSIVFNAIDYASVQQIECWDAYLIMIGKKFHTNNLYTIDIKLKKISDFNIINPVSQTKFNEYQKFLKDLFKKPKKVE